MFHLDWLGWSEGWNAFCNVLGTRKIDIPIMARPLRVCLFSHCDNTKFLCTTSVTLNDEKAHKFRVCIALVTRSLQLLAWFFFSRGSEVSVHHEVQIRWLRFHWLWLVASEGQHHFWQRHHYCHLTASLCRSGFEQRQKQDTLGWSTGCRCSLPHLHPTTLGISWHT